MPRRKASKARWRDYHTVPEIAAVVGWPLLKVRRWLKRAGVLEKRGSTLVVSSERLNGQFPAVYRSILEAEIMGLTARDVRPEQPLYVTVPQVAKMLGWSLPRARRWLRREELVEKTHGTLVTTMERLVSVDPRLRGRVVGDESGRGAGTGSRRK